MRPSKKLLLCCLFLAGCVEAEAEVATKAVDFSKPVPPEVFYIYCGSLEGVETYPIPLDPAFTAGGRYSISASIEDVSARNSGEGRFYIETPGERTARENVNFFVKGLKNGCTGVFSGFNVWLMRMKRLAEAPLWMGHDATEPVGTYTDVEEIDAKIAESYRFPESKRNLDRNSLFIKLFAWVSPRVTTELTIMILDGEVYSSDTMLLDQ